MKLEVRLILSDEVPAGIVLVEYEGTYDKDILTALENLGRRLSRDNRFPLDDPFQRP